MSEVREKPEKGRPFCWEEKAARRLLLERNNGDTKGVYVLAVYGALCEIASNESSARFTASHPHIAGKTPCGITSLKAALHEIKEAGLLLIETPILRGPCTFTLLWVSRATANDGRNTTSVSRASISASATTVEEPAIKSTPETVFKSTYFDKMGLKAAVSHLKGLGESDEGIQTFITDQDRKGGWKGDWHTDYSMNYRPSSVPPRSQAEQEDVDQKRKNMLARQVQELMNSR